MILPFMVQKTQLLREAGRSEEVNAFRTVVAYIIIARSLSPRVFLQYPHFGYALFLCPPFNRPSLTLLIL